MILGIIQGCTISKVLDTTGKEIVTFIADADIDCDGTGGNPHHDPCFQPATRLKFQGKSLCAEKEAYVVVPPLVIHMTKGRVMGSQCVLRNIENDKTCLAVVGDSGPTKKIGELSPRAAELLGLDPDPNHGGTSKHIIEYVIHVGVPAYISGKLYELQAS